MLPYTGDYIEHIDDNINNLEFIGTSLKKGLILDDTKVLTELECFDKSNGAGDVAILAAIYLTSRYANNPSLGIKIPAFSFGADTDTVASITGGLLGMLHLLAKCDLLSQVVFQMEKRYCNNQQVMTKESKNSC